MKDSAALNDLAANTRTSTCHSSHETGKCRTSCPSPTASSGSVVFTSCTNAVTGRDEWLPRHADYDYQQEVARSAYADMLHDGERNDKYEQGLRAAIAHLRAAGRPVHVLDIGTGSGLLAMMAARLGADSVTACEAFAPMAACAGRVLRDNGWAERVRLLPKRSTDLTVTGETADGGHGDLPRRCTLLVAEVFDTELIGEGALATFRHAHRCLLEPASVVVPSSAVMYAQPVESALVRRWNRFTPLVYGSGSEGGGGGDDAATADALHVPEDVRECHGAAAVHDLQLSRLPSGAFTPLTEPLPVFAFDWTCGNGGGGGGGDEQSPSPLALERTSVTRVESCRSGTVHAVLMWWDLAMDPAGHVLLSCAPRWAHPLTLARQQQQSGDVSAATEAAAVEDIPWRDHWMQAIYYVPRELWVRRGAAFNLVSSHDEYSVWFAVDDRPQPPVAGHCADPAPICLCGLHVTLSRTRVGALNDPRRHRLYTAALRDAIRRVSSSSTGQLTVLVLSDACLYGVCAARMLAAAADGGGGGGRVLAVESSRIGRRALQMYSVDNDVDDRLEFVEPDQLQQRLEAAATEQAERTGAGDRGSKAVVDVLFAEPFYYSTTMLPWQPLHFWYRKHQLRHYLHEQTQVVPFAARLYCMPVEFAELWKIRAPVDRVSGFDLAAFDRLVLTACDRVDAACEPQPLWEYASRALAAPVLLDTFDIGTAAPSDTAPLHGRAPFTAEGQCNGVALWMDWLLDGGGDGDDAADAWQRSDRRVLTTGPVAAPSAGAPVHWDMYSRQAVYFVRPAAVVRAQQHRLCWRYSFDSRSANVDVQFSVEACEDCA